MNLRFGLLWPFRNPDFGNALPWDRLYAEHLELIVESERLGFDHVWLSEHHFVDDGYSCALFPIAGAIAARTTRIRIGTFLLLLPLHDPIRVAEDSATVDILSNGRFDLGVGLGYRVHEFEDQGVSRRERGARVEEGVQLIRRLLSGESVTMEGRFSTLHDIRVTPPAIQQPHPPIWVGGTAPAAVERVARLGFPFLNGSQVATTKLYDDALRAHGRDPDAFRVGSMRPLYIAETRERAWEIAAGPLRAMAADYLRWNAEGNLGVDGDALVGALPTVEAMVRAQAFDFFGEPSIVGTPDDAIELIEDHLARGRLTDFAGMIALPGIAPSEIASSMELFAREVIPHFRGA
jgi:alkanesulfonate monooxygenase SsuD/methylene tetrahydromethanopterin reductase-like flavin-dependent oxidoreductase (luciferase family)